MKRRGFEFSFAWLFAIIAGVAILIFAVVLSAKLITTSTFEADTETAKKITIVFDPLETGAASSKTGSFKLNTQIRIYQTCQEDGSFGREEFSVSSKHPSKNEWSDKSVPIRLSNKYIYARNPIEGKEFYFISKPFEMPFRVADVVVLYSGSYCFVQAPDFIIEELNTTTLGNLKFVSDLKECGSTATGSYSGVRVCFGSMTSKECNVTVKPKAGIGGIESYDSGITSIKGKEVHYTGNLVYASIFSDWEVYECNTKRLMMRLNNLALLYQLESQFISGRTCSTGVEAELNALSNSANGYEDSGDLSLVESFSGRIKQNGVCDLWQ